MTADITKIIGKSTANSVVTAIKDDGTVLLSYSYDSDYNTDVVFVTDYDPDSTDAPGTDDKDASIDTVVLDSATGAVPLTLKGEVCKDTKYEVALYQYSIYQNQWVEMGTKTVTILAGEQTVTSDAFQLIDNVNYKAVINGVESQPVVG